MSEPTWELLGGGGVVGGPIDYVGDWAAGTQYQPGQVVRYGGVDYLAVNPSLGQVPPSAVPLPVGMVCLYDSVLSAAAANFDIQNISQIYANLRVMIQARGDAAVAATNLLLRMNGVSTASYFDVRGSDTEVAHTPGGNVVAQTAALLGFVTAASAVAGYASTTVADIPNYSGSVFHKAFTAQTYHLANAGTGNQTIVLNGGVLGSPSPVNRLTIFPLTGNFVAGSRVTLYGLRGLP